MDNAIDILINKRFKETIDNFSTETLKLIVEDEMKALEAVRKSIVKAEPARIDNVRCLQDVANGMQKLASMILEKRNTQNQ